MNISQELDKVITNIPPTEQNYDQFTEAVKTALRKKILRGHRENDIPGMRQNLLKDYEQYAKKEDEYPFVNDIIEMEEQLLENIVKSRRDEWIVVVRKYAGGNYAKMWNTIHGAHNIVW